MFGGFFGLLFLAAIAWFVWYLFARGRAGTNVFPAPPRGDDAVEVLRARYARGELSREDYLQALEDLNGPPGGRI